MDNLVFIIYQIPEDVAMSIRESRCCTVKYQEVKILLKALVVLSIYSMIKCEVIWIRIIPLKGDNDYET